jgi:hypothetical protein
VSFWGRVRNGLARVLAAAGAVFWGFFFFGLIDFMTPFTLGEEWADHYLLETGWGLLYLVLVTVPLLVLVVRPGSAVALLQLAAVALAVLLGAVLAWSPAHALPAVGLLLTAGALAALAPLRTAGLARPSPITAAVTVIGAVPAAAYAWHMARATENPEDTWGLDHYPAQAALAIAVLLVALLAACVVGGPGRGWWLPVGTAAFSSVWLGWQSVLWPERVGSLGSVGGVAAVVWGLALVAAAVADARVLGSREAPATMNAW